MTRSDTHKNWILRAVAVLLCLTVASICVTSGAYARYTTGATFYDSARVARFEVNAVQGSGQNTELGLALGEDSSAEYSFTVTSNSEVTVQYDVLVTFPSKLNGVTLTLKNGEKFIAATTSDNITYRFGNVGTFDAGAAQTDTLTLTFAIPLTATIGNFVGEGIKIEVHAEQVD